MSSEYIDIFHAPGPDDFERWRQYLAGLGIDECKEMTREDFEKVKDHPLLGKAEGGIQTSKSNDWFYRFVESRFIGEDCDDEEEEDEDE
jgi:hypothetical protein